MTLTAARGFRVHAKCIVSISAAANPMSAHLWRSLPVTIRDALNNLPLSTFRPSCSAASDRAATRSGSQRTVSPPSFETSVGTSTSPGIKLGVSEPARPQTMMPAASALGGDVGLPMPVC